MKAIIFDMDGVIIDSEQFHAEISIALVEEYGGKISREEFEIFLGKTDYDIWSTLKEQFNLEPSVDELMEIEKQRSLQNIHKIELVEHFYEFMMSAYRANYALALASSNNRAIVDKVLERFELSKYLKVAISGDDVVKGKPDPEIFLKAAEMLGVKAEKCLVIEDAFAGVQAAKAAGMKCIGYKSPTSKRQDLSDADLIVQSLGELSLDIVEKLLGEN
ncbi:MAG: HAD family phosphatase [Tepidanaerobacteraceae bacterium]